MGFTVQFLMFVFGLSLVTKALHASTENEIRIRRDSETHCIWQCPEVLRGCLREGREKSACKRIARRCAWLCIVDGMNAKRENIR